MKLSEKAEETPDVDLARHSAGAYVMQTDELTSADELSAEGEFPQFGDFLKVTGTSGEQYVECPAGLARWLVEHDLDVGDGFRILTARKVDNEWQYDCEELDDDEVDRLST